MKQGKQSPRVSCPIEDDTDHEPAEQCLLLRCLPRHGMPVWNKSWIGGGPEGGAFLDPKARSPLFANSSGESRGDGADAALGSWSGYLTVVYMLCYQARFTAANSSPYPQVPQGRREAESRNEREFPAREALGMPSTSIADEPDSLAGSIPNPPPPCQRHPKSSAASPQLFQQTGRPVGFSLAELSIGVCIVSIYPPGRPRGFRGCAEDYARFGKYGLTPYRTIPIPSHQRAALERDSRICLPRPWHRTCHGAHMAPLGGRLVTNAPFRKHVSKKGVRSWS